MGVAVEGAIEKAAVRAIDYMRAHLGEQLTVDDMARAALFSKFHFSRTFQQVTGVSPGRFLSALRIQRAKQLLLATSMNVADISIQVGYASVGTFSSRFSRSVGLSPTAFRRTGGYAIDVPTVDRMVLARRMTGGARGRIRALDAGQSGPVFIGLFPERIPEGRPAQCAVLDGPGEYRLDKVPVGAWYLLAHWMTDPDDPGAAWVGSCGPLVVRPGMVVEADVQLDPMTSLHPPVLLALLDIRQDALAA
ncbi:AraC family transcriptional regulator [Solwaraspora sp. WMMD406]|uniref:helix-turn-helix domain-containing protein n=1 Tax=Solwaraspora sp. WMMD406 TaxID=3016095 RepID=UPI002417C61B|nr:AraC family transcriptional regulator [Solwaraspora sp. WMMD406]MDG4764711.1 AraC family transcriptional regulator [Solwaraspora sp. WMMD406]